MKFASLFLVATLAAPLRARSETPAQCTRAWDERTAAHAQGADSYKTFMMACLRNRVSPSLPTEDRPAGALTQATARCRDGFYSYSANPTATCAQHRGVQAWLR